MSSRVSARKMTRRLSQAGWNSPVLRELSPRKPETGKNFCLLHHETTLTPWDIAGQSLTPSGFCGQARSQGVKASRIASKMKPNPAWRKWWTPGLAQGRQLSKMMPGARAGIASAICFSSAAGHIQAQPFNSRTFTLSAILKPSAKLAFPVSQNGVLAYHESSAESRTKLF